MSEEYRVGAACLSHDHVWGELWHWKQQPGVQLTAGGDDEPELLERLQKEFDVERIYSSWQELLEKEDLQILQVAGGNSESADIVEAAAARGIHVCVEKPMAATLEQADRMLAAAERANILLLINWPTAWSAAWQELVKRIQAGDIGEVRYTRYRSAHSGPIAIGCSPQFVRDLTTPSINGAGALMDYCCYGANLAATLLGRPDKVTGMRGHFGTEPAYAASEDNAIIVAQYQHAFGVCEASWSQPVGYAEANPVVYGSSGSLAVLHGRLLLQTPGSPVQEITPAPTEEPKRSAPEYMLHCLKTGSPIEGFCSPAVSRNAQEILQAGLDSTNTLATRTLPNT